MIIRAALDLAVRRGLIKHNVAQSEQIRLVRTRGTTARSWTAAELATFLGVARSHRLYPALHLAAHTGMRRGEVVGLKWSDLDTTTGCPGCGGRLGSWGSARRRVVRRLGGDEHRRRHQPELGVPRPPGLRTVRLGGPTAWVHAIDHRPARTDPLRPSGPCRPR
jgi:integrase